MIGVVPERLTNGAEAASLDDALARSGALAGMAWNIRVSSRRRTVGLTVERDASVTVAVPAEIETSSVVDFVRDHRGWLLGKAARRSAGLADHPTKRIVSGESYPYLGRHQRLLVIPDQTVPVKRVGGWLSLRSMDVESGARAIIDWYAGTGQRWLAPRAARWAQRLGVADHGVTVRDLGLRWGLLDPERGPVLHWALFQLAPSIVDYVVVHELAHHAEPHHGRSFWTCVERAVPDYRDRKERLADLGRTVWLGAVYPAQAGEEPPRPGGSRSRGTLEVVGS
jgi:predicted metal-dependent hydrolase